ncbi:MAG: GHKL domain-containing protein [Planctomycetes bacterium]|nr:GHKL domain-containing protein [Planctomycetota bacterium]
MLDTIQRMARRVLGSTLVVGVVLSVCTSARPLDRLTDHRRVTTWTTADGLPQNTINDMVQTADGALWIATFGGLLRFDGLQFRVFDRHSLPGLPSIRVTALATDKSGGLWVAVQSGEIVYMRDGRVTQTIKVPAELSEPLVVKLAPDSSMYVRGSSGALAQWSAGTWDAMIPMDFGSGSYENLIIGQGGEVWAGMLREVRRFDARAGLLDSFPVDGRVPAIASSADGVWLGLERGSLARLFGGVLERLEFDGESPEVVTAILPDGAGSLWLGTNRGPRLAHPLADGRYRLEAPPSGVPTVFVVRAFLLDREGNLWVGSEAHGLLRITRRYVDRFALPDESPATALAPDGDGGAWIGFGCSGLAHLARDEQTLQRVSMPAVADRKACIDSLMIDHERGLWIGGQGHVLLRTGAHHAPIHVPLRNNDKTGPIVRTRDGHTWVALESGVLLHFDEELRALESTNVPGLVCLVPGEDGSLWLGGTGFVERRFQDRVERYDSAVGMPQSDVRDILLEPDGSAWIATYGDGLVRLAEGRVTVLSLAHGLPDSAISRILDDRLGRLWLLSNRGLIPVARSELSALADGRVARIDPVLLGPESGVSEANFGGPAGFRADDGRLWFGTIAGVVRLDPAEFPFNRTPPTVRIEGLVTEDTTLDLWGTVEVPPATRRIVFAFTASALAAPEKVRFKFMLAGYDDQWVDGGDQRQVSYTGLAPGDYTFRVLARNEDGVWSQEAARLPVRVLPAWWQTLPVRIAAVLVIVGLLLGVHMLRLQAAERRGRALLEATEGRARAELRASHLRDDLAHVSRVATAGELATSLAHEVNQPLGAIVANAEAGLRALERGQADVKDMEEILRAIARQGERTSEVIQRLRQFMRKHAGERQDLNLNTTAKEVLPLLRRELEEHAVEVTLDLDEDLPGVVADRIQMQQVLVNLVKNACEAMSATAGPRRVELRTQKRNGRVILEVRDSGPGLAPDVVGRVFQPFVTTKSTGMGLGLSICRSIVEAHGGRLDVSSASGSGSTFSVELPLKNPKGAAT